jgi:hypothetical protein
VSLPTPTPGFTEVYQLKFRVALSPGQYVAVGWAPRDLALDESPFDGPGYWADLRDGWLTCYHQKNAVIPQPEPRKLGCLQNLQNAAMIYDRAGGTISFAWPGRAPELAYIQVPGHPRLFPAFSLYGARGDTVELLPD